MEVVCETTQSKDTQIRVAALQCLVKINSLYYEYMESYMAQALFPVRLTFAKLCTEPNWNYCIHVGFRSRWKR